MMASRNCYLALSQAGNAGLCQAGANITASRPSRVAGPSAQPPPEIPLGPSAATTGDLNDRNYGFSVDPNVLRRP
jgi:hypothetical protein